MIPPPLGFSRLCPLTAPARSFFKLALALTLAACPLMLAACGGGGGAVGGGGGGSGGGGGALLDTPLFASAKSGGGSVNQAKFDFYEGSSGGMSYRWDGDNSDTYDATNITVNLSFSSGTTVASVGLNSANVTVTANTCTSSPCGDNYYSNGEALFTDVNVSDSGYLEAGLIVDVTTTTDYMAGGYWGYGSTTGNYQDMELGGFVYASSLAEKTGVGALTSGTATFAGKTKGFGYGPKDGVYRVGHLSGNVALTAYFASTIPSINGKLSDLTFDAAYEDGRRLTLGIEDIDLAVYDFSSSYSTAGYVRSERISSTDDDLTTRGGWAAAFTGSETSITSIYDLSGIAGTYAFRLIDSDNASNWDNFFGAFLARRN